MNDPFERAWKDVFGATPPLGHYLRADFYEFWTRFHALPKSKRYAENRAERQTILDRGNLLGSACFSHEEPVWLVSCPFAELVEGAGSATDFDLWPRLQMRCAFECEDPGEIERYVAFADMVTWRPGAFDDLLGNIAQDRCRALLFSPASGRVMAPYDGGFDIISPDQSWIGVLEQRYRGWMSARMDKL